MMHWFEHSGGWHNEQSRIPVTIARRQEGQRYALCSIGCTLGQFLAIALGGVTAGFLKGVMAIGLHGIGMVIDMPFERCATMRCWRATLCTTPGARSLTQGCKPYSPDDNI